MTWALEDIFFGYSFSDVAAAAVIFSMTGNEVLIKLWSALERMRTPTPGLKHEISCEL